MLDFNLLEQASKKYHDTVIEKAEECSEMVRQITDKFTKLKVPTTNYSWTEVLSEADGLAVSCYLVWDDTDKKVLFSIEDGKPDVLLGCTAQIRAEVRAKVPHLIHEAIEAFEEMGEEIENAHEIEADNNLNAFIDSTKDLDAEDIEDLEDDEEDTTWKEPADGGPSHGDIMMTNGND